LVLALATSTAPAACASGDGENGSEDSATDPTTSSDATTTGNEASTDGGDGDTATGDGDGDGDGDPAVGEVPVAGINSPGEGNEREVNVTFPVTGFATDAEDGDLWDESLVWTDSLEGQIGTGGIFDFTPTVVGSHTLTLSATDSDANVGVDEVTFNVYDTPPPPDP
jgi:chitinase